MVETTRRHFLRVSILDFLYYCAAWPSLAQQGVSANGPASRRLNWDAFIDQIESAASEQRQPKWDQDRYVKRVATLAASLNLKDRFLTGAAKGYRDIHRFQPEISDLLQKADVQISLISFERGETISHHDHPDMTGVMVCATGSVQVKEYNLIRVPSRAGYLLNFSGEQELTPGSVATLTARSNNIHSVRAGGFSQIVDIFTPPYNEDRKKRTRWFEVERAPVQGSPDMFVAHDIHTK